MGFKVVPLTNGGTGATSAADARTNLAVNSAAEEAARDGLILEVAGAPASPAAGRIVLYRDTNDSNKLKVKTSAGVVSFLNEIVGEAASNAALEAAYPAASNTGKYGLVTGTGTESGLVQSNGSAWVVKLSANTYTKAEMDALDEFESKEINGVVTITPKATHSTDEFRIGTAVTTYETLEADFVYADVEISKSKISAASTDATLAVGTVGATYDDNDNNFASVNVGGQNDVWIWEFTPNQVFTKFSLNQYSDTGQVYKIGSFKLEYHDGSSYQTIFANQACTAPHHSFEDFAFPTPVVGGKIRMTILTCGQSGYNDHYAIYEVNFYGAEYHTTPNLVPSGTLNFAPASLVVKDGNGDVINTLDGTAYKIAFKKTIAGNTTDYATEENPSVFIARAASQFAACQALFLRVFPIGNQSVSSISIENTSSSITIKPSGEIVAEIDGIEVWKTTADGDATQVDTTVASLTATGAIQGATVKATTAAQLSEQGSDPGTVSNVGQLYTKSDNLLYFRDGDGNVHSVPAQDQESVYETRVKGYVETINASTTAVVTVSTITQNAVTRVTAEVIGVSTDGVERCYYIRSALLYRATGSSSLVGAVAGEVEIESSSNASQLDATIAASGNGFVVNVSGVDDPAAKTIKWRATVTMAAVTTSTAS